MRLKIFTLLFMLVGLVGCDKSPEAMNTDQEAELARNAVGVDGATALWRCAGRMESGSSEFMAATLQQDNNGNHMLSVSKVQVAGKKATQNALLTQKVTINKLKTHDNKETYLAVGSRTNFELNWAYAAAETVGSYDYKSEELLVQNIKPNGLPLQVDCKNALVK